MTYHGDGTRSLNVLLFKSLSNYVDVDGSNLIFRSSTDGEQMLPFVQSSDITRNWQEAVSALIANPTGVARSEGRLNAWEAGWSKCVEEALNNPHNFLSFVPHYIRESNGQYLVNALPAVFEKNPEIEMAKAAAQMITDLAKINGASSILECGCGTGWRLGLLRQQGFKGRLIGTDWTEASKVCVQLLNDNFQTGINFEYMDLTNPKSLEAEDNTLVLTYGALEQLGTEWSAFWNTCQDQKYKNFTYVHFEPFSSMYDLSNPLEQSMLAVHKAKNYLEGYAEHLLSAQKAGKIDLHAYRAPLGARFLETANIIVWKFV